MYAAAHAALLMHYIAENWQLHQQLPSNMLYKGVTNMYWTMRNDKYNHEFLKERICWQGVTLVLTYAPGKFMILEIEDLHQGTA